MASTKLKFNTVYVSYVLMLTVFIIWTAVWIQKKDNFKWHARAADVKVAAALLTDNKFIASRENIEYSYSFFILAAQKLFSDEINGSMKYEELYEHAKKAWITPTVISLYVIYLFSFIITWYALKKRIDAKSANILISVLILFLLNNRAITVSLFREPLYIALILIVFSVIALSFHSEKRGTFFILGLVTALASSVRPFPMYGIAFPLLVFFVWKYLKERNKNFLHYIVFFITGIVVWKIIMFCILGFFFNFDIPKKSDAYNITMRLLHFDGICYRSNGPASKILMDIDKKIAPERHKEGWIDENKKTYRYVFENYSIEEMNNLYYEAAKESVLAFPYIALRNTVLNILSFFTHEHLLYAESRRNSNLDYWPMDPEEWKEPLKIIITAVQNNLKYPFWIILFIMLGIKKIRENMDPSLIIFLCFCAVNILITSLVGRYLLRFSLPMYAAAFIPFGIMLRDKYFYYIWALGGVFILTIILKIS